MNRSAHPAFVCCNVRIDAIGLEDAVAQLKTYAERGGGRSLHLCNAYTLATALRDPEYAAALNRGDLNLADGAPLAWIGRRLGFASLRSRVYGPDLMLAVADSGRSWGLRHYLYGSSNEVLHALADQLQARFPGLELVGAEAPPFRPLTGPEEASLVERVNGARPDVMWVGLGTPKQDWFVDAFRDRVRASLVPVGAAFEFIAGTKAQAPRWMQDRGLEWLFRLGTEPGRLWRRYLFGNLMFLGGVARGVRVLDQSS